VIDESISDPVWDQVADRYDGRFTRHIDLAEDRVLYGWLAPYLNGACVADLGCGTAALLDHCDPVYYMGVDASQKMLDVAAAKHPTSAFLCSRADEPLDHMTFDTVVSLWAFPYFDCQLAALLNMFNLLRPGGRVFVMGWTRRYRERASHIADASLIKPTTARGLTNAMSVLGFEDVKVRGFRYLLDPPGLDRLSPAALASAFRASSKLLPASWAFTHIVEGVKPC
jgi:SAM-dependent methyltransferase